MCWKCFVIQFVGVRSKFGKMGGRKFGKMEGWKFGKMGGGGSLVKWGVVSMEK